MQVVINNLGDYNTFLTDHDNNPDRVYSEVIFDRWDTYKDIVLTKMTIKHLIIKNSKCKPSLMLANMHCELTLHNSTLDQLDVINSKLILDTKNLHLNNVTFRNTVVLGRFTPVTLNQCHAINSLLDATINQITLSAIKTWYKSAECRGYLNVLKLPRLDLDIVFTSEWLLIGCQKHRIKDWFDDDYFSKRIRPYIWSEDKCKWDRHKSTLKDLMLVQYPDLVF